MMITLIWAAVKHETLQLLLFIVSECLQGQTPIIHCDIAVLLSSHRQSIIYIMVSCGLQTVDKTKQKNYFLESRLNIILIFVQTDGSGLDSPKRHRIDAVPGKLGSHTMQM